MSGVIVKVVCLTVNEWRMILKVVWLTVNEWRVILKVVWLTVNEWRVILKVVWLTKWVESDPEGSLADCKWVCFIRLLGIYTVYWTYARHWLNGLLKYKLSNLHMVKWKCVNVTKVISSTCWGRTNYNLLGEGFPLLAHSMVEGGSEFCPSGRWAETVCRRQQTGALIELIDDRVTDVCSHWPSAHVSDPSRS